MPSLHAITTAPRFEPSSDAGRVAPAATVEPPVDLRAASLGDTAVLVLAIGAIVLVCGVVTLMTLHPISLRAIAEWGLAIIARR